MRDEELEGFIVRRFQPGLISWQGANVTEQKQTGILF